MESLYIYRKTFYSRYVHVAFIWFARRVWSPVGATREQTGKYKEEEVGESFFDQRQTRNLASS